MDVPSHIHYIPLDLSTLFWSKGIDPDISREAFANMKTVYGKHNALHDAMLIKKCFDLLT